MRTCKRCDSQKPIDQFAKARIKNGKQYYRYFCVPCYSATKIPRRNKLREMYVAFKKASKCARCGNDDWRVLEFDHLQQKSFNLSDYIRRGVVFETILMEAKKCQVLCANCHRIKTFEASHGV